ncbi:hypothetical protein C5S36_10095 [Candidatus Methanophagaceae archaeon]|nr:hypothetical protein C5S36_10095 [Methanophagales archaeon]
MYEDRLKEGITLAEDGVSDVANTDK